MSMYLDRLTRVCPPRGGGGVGAGAVRVVACNASTSVVEVDNDIFQFAAPANTAPTPGAYGRALTRFQAEGNDIYINFGPTNAVAANSAATSGASMCLKIPAGQDRDWELDPAVDKFFQATTVNGGSLTANLRYAIVSFPMRDVPAQG